jgi:hypothetical protein
VPTPRAVAEELTKSFEAEHALGNYDYLLPKKYQKEAPKAKLTEPRLHDMAMKHVAMKKKSSAQLQREIEESLSKGSRKR